MQGIHANRAVSYILVISGLRLPLQGSLMNMLVINLENAYGLHLGQKTVLQNQMLRENLLQGTEIITENVVITTNDISMNTGIGQAIMRLEVHNVIVVREVVSDYLGSKKRIVGGEERKIVNPHHLVDLNNGVLKNIYISLKWLYL